MRMQTNTRTGSVPVAAKMLGVSAPTAYRTIAAGTFPVPAIRIGKRIVVPLEPLERLLAGDIPVGERIDDYAAGEGEATQTEIRGARAA
jgi:predicted DNA-binding transcriptional regulator AlpA